ncbi:glutamate--tRNA ligase [Candidatus Auribacterota bacterium]
MKKIRTRFAPSPTGYLHIGGARTALFNWLYAKNRGGSFVLRIEDTDRVRSTPEAVDAIINSMKWLGLEWDEGPFFQSQRNSVYREYADKLLQQGKAYFSEPDAEGRKAVIFKIPHEKIALDDAIYGRIEFDNSLIKDLVIIKSDGMPTYNFACVIDDALMEISHIIRGEDHVSNTPKQIPVYRALGLDMPVFAHVPMIMGEDKSRLSKRHGAAAVENYRDEGNLPEALKNYLVLLGWSPGDNRELFKSKEMIDEFSLSKVSKKSAIFSTDKLQWMNAQYMKEINDEALFLMVKEYLLAGGIIKPDFNDDELKTIIGLHRERAKILKDYADLAGFFFAEEINYSDELLNKFIKIDEIKNVLRLLVNKLKERKDYNVEYLEVLCRGLTEEYGLKPKKFFQAIRVAITGQTFSPGLFETMTALGKETVIKRIETVLEIAQ